MMQSSLALISQRHHLGPYGDWRDMLENNYTEYLERHGIYVLPVPNCVQDLLPYMAGTLSIRGVILTGGNDVGPFTYGGDPVDDIDANTERSVSSHRDRTERALLDFAVGHGLPVLGICRGVQFINVYFGGRIVQDIEREYGRPTHKIGQRHSIDIVDDRAREYLGIDDVKVNSYHHQAVTAETLAPALRAFAWEPDSQIVEGLYHPEYPIAGVQYHPEREAPESRHNALLMEAFREGKLFWESRPTT
jgi:gamma-glutamyl-gamma-aminobutyrate hydrolase PuuD